MVKKLVTNQDMASLLSLKGTVSLCDTCIGCDIRKKWEAEKTALYEKAPRHTIHMVIWACNQYSKKPKTRGRPRKTSNP